MIFPLWSDTPAYKLDMVAVFLHLACKQETWQCKVLYYSVGEIDSLAESEMATVDSAAMSNQMKVYHCLWSDEDRGVSTVVLHSTVEIKW